MSLAPHGPITANRVPVASYPTYQEAEKAVDFLSDHGFPVQGTLIVGVGLRSVEQVVSRIASRPLDRSKPLWEVYRIEGVDGGSKFAVYSKTHHAAIDGASGTQIVLASMQTMMDSLSSRWRSCHTQT